MPAYSFYSITEVSEYVPDAEEYGRILRDREGVDPESSVYKTKVAAYAERLGPMNQQRLYPEFPDWPCLCFYPMSKMRRATRTGTLLPFETRSELMSQHGQERHEVRREGVAAHHRLDRASTTGSGASPSGRGTRSYLKDIVYTMRFDESSARYALFGDFYFGYILPPAELLETVRL